MRSLRPREFDKRREFKTSPNLRFNRRTRRWSIEPLELRLALSAAPLWSTYLGGSDFDAPYGMAVDSAGNVLVTGDTLSDGWVSGGFDTTFNDMPPPDDVDPFVVKLSPSGDHLWSSYLGGASNEWGLAIAVDSDGNVLVAGQTSSSGWISGGYDTTYNGGADAFVVKLSPTGEHLWSTYVGGSNYDGGRNGNGIAVDADGNVFVTGQTLSPGWVSGGFDTTFNSSGSYDAFVVKLSPNGQHLWSSYLGGDVDNRGLGVAVDAVGNVLVAGQTSSPGWVSGGFDATYNGGGDAYVAKLSSSGAHLWSTYLGGDIFDQGLGLALDSADNILVTGTTTSAGWVSGGYDTTHGGGEDAFATKLSPTGMHLWSTYLGADGGQRGYDIAVDSADNAVITGGNSFDSTLVWVSGGFDTTPSGSDSFVVKLSPSGGHQSSTYLGGSGSERGHAIALDSGDRVVVAGTTDSTDWVWGGFDTSYNGGSRDGFVLKLSTDNLPPDPGAPTVDAGADQTIFVNGAAVLDGTVTDDGLPLPLVTTWSQVAGPGTVTFGDAAAVDTTANFSRHGTYWLKLEATDGQFTTSDYVEVVVNSLTADLTAVADTYISGSGGSTTKNFGASSSVIVDGSPDNAALFRWDLSGIPAGSELQSVSFSFNVTGTSSDTYEIYELKRNWSEVQATWNKATTGSNWQTAGAQGASDRGSAVLGAVTGSTTGPRSIVLDAVGLAVVQGWVNAPATNFGFILQDYANATKDDLVLSSREAATASRPKLTVVYDPPAPAASSVVVAAADNGAVGHDSTHPPKVVARQSRVDRAIARPRLDAGRTTVAATEASHAAAVDHVLSRLTAVRRRRLSTPTLLEV